MKRLSELKAGESALIIQVGGEGAMRQHFLDMGVIPGTKVTVNKFAPMGDPMELRIHEYELTLRLDDAALIGVRDLEDSEIDASHGEETKRAFTEHPGAWRRGTISRPQR